MNKYNKLKQELALPEYSAMTDQEVYDALILEDIAAKQSISTHDIQIYFESIDKLYTIRTHASDDAKHVTMVFDQFSNFDMADSVQEAVITDTLQNIVTAGVITQTDMDVVIAYGDIVINRVTELGISVLTLADITLART